MSELYVQSADEYSEHRLSHQMIEFDHLVSNAISGHDSIDDTPWVERNALMSDVARAAVMDWWGKQWPIVCESATKHLNEAKRRVMT